jgi:hypothetical protein
MNLQKERKKELTGDETECQKTPVDDQKEGSETPVLPRPPLEEKK